MRGGAFRPLETVVVVPHIVATRDEKREVSEGDLIVFPPGKEHWHGNKEDATSPFTHIYFLAESEDGELTVLEAP